MEFWRYRCIIIFKREKIEILKFVFNFFKKSLEIKKVEYDFEEEVKVFIFLRLYLVDVFVFFRKDDIKLLLVLKVVEMVIKLLLDYCIVKFLDSNDVLI